MKAYKRTKTNVIAWQSPWNHVVAIGVIFTLLLAACGDDNGNTSKASSNDDGREVATIVDMGRCTSEREGDTVYVAEKLTDYLCKNKSWVDLSEISDGNNSQSSSSTAAIPGNTESGASSSSLDKEAYTGDNLVVKNRSILGVAQKGPFKFGSPVYLRELSEDNLKYTGMVYEDEISSNKGDFVIPNVNLISPYACVEVRGLFRNEISGEYSKDSISLFALTDLKTALSDVKNEPRNKVNVNLLTHLEYSRALYLVRKGYSVYAAKKQADQEIMTAFELPTTIKYSEDLSVFEDSQDDNVNYANASLMMLSLLFLGERNDAEIKAEIEKFVEDFEKDGSWDDAETKAAMADYATEIDTLGIRANVKAWNILDIPKFENPLETFWNNVYGLGGCSDKRKDVVAPNSNKLSKNYNKYFICNSIKWVVATTYQKDTYEWTAGKHGEFKKGNVTDTIYVYDAYDGSMWKVAERETAIGLCLDGNAGVVKEHDLTYYICKNGAWKLATLLEFDTYGLTGVEGDVKAGVVNKDKYYVYENGAWRAAADDQEVALGICTTAREGVVAENGGVYYICRSKTWEVATPFESDTYGWEAGTDGEVRTGSTNAYNYYVYENGAWRASANTIENDLGACVTSREGEVGKSGSTYYICKSNTWKTATVLEYDTYGWKAGTEGEIKAGNVNVNKYYIYKSGKWQTATSIEKDLGGCTTGREGEVDKLGDTYYICKSKAWTTASILEYDTYGLTGVEGDVKAGNVNTGYYYIYKNGKWQSATSVEQNLGGCTTSREGEVGKSGSTYYICKSKAWTTATALEYNTYGWEAGTEGEVRAGSVNTGTYYIYKNGQWQTATSVEKNLGGCTANREGEVGKSGSTYYICKSKAWTTATALQYDTYGWGAGAEGEVRKGDVSTDRYYIYKNSRWQTATTLEYDTYGKTCLTDGSIVDGEVVSSNKYVCDAGAFRKAQSLETSLDKGCVSYTDGYEIRKKQSEVHDSVYLCNSSLWNETIEITGPLADSRDNKTYRVVAIGRQIWMAENLNYKTSESSCYDNNCSKYGRFYTWSEAKKACPSGWHLPHTNEWSDLVKEVGGTVYAIKSQTGWSDAYGNGSDRVGFSVLPTPSTATFWTATERQSSCAYLMEVKYNSWDGNLTNCSIEGHYSVRCLQD